LKNVQEIGKLIISWTQ